MFYMRFLPIVCTTCKKNTSLRQNPDIENRHKIESPQQRLLANCAINGCNSFEELVIRGFDC